MLPTQRRRLGGLGLVRVIIFLVWIVGEGLDAQDWTPLGPPGGQPVRQIVVDPTDSRNVWALTDTIYPSQSRLYRSSDGGASWNLLPISLGKDERVTTMLVDSTFSGKVFVATDYQRLMSSSDDAKTWVVLAKLPGYGIRVLGRFDEARSRLFAAMAVRGIYVSDDEGRSWTPKNVGLPEDADPMCVVVDPEKTDSLYMDLRASIPEYGWG